MAAKPVCHRCGCYPFPAPRIAWGKPWCGNCFTEQLDMLEAELRAEQAAAILEDPPTDKEIDDFLAQLGREDDKPE